MTSWIILPILLEIAALWLRLCLLHLFSCCLSLLVSSIEHSFSIVFADFFLFLLIIILLLLFLIFLVLFLIFLKIMKKSGYFIVTVCQFVTVLFVLQKCCDSIFSIILLHFLEFSHQRVHLVRNIVLYSLLSFHVDGDVDLCF